MPPGALPLVADLADPKSLEVVRHAGLIRSIVYCASADARTDEAYERAYVRGLDNLLDAVDARLVERVIFTASTAVYHQDSGWVDESSPTEPTSFTGRRLLEAERLLHAFPATTISLRLGGIYGPGRTRMVRSVERGELGPDRYTNRIHLDDCAGALEHLLRVEHPDPVYVGVDDDPAPLSEVAAFIAHRLEVDAPALEGPPSGKRCRNAKLVESGYGFEMPSYRDGYPAIIDEYRGRGQG